MVQLTWFKGGWILACLPFCEVQKYKILMNISETWQCCPSLLIRSDPVDVPWPTVTLRPCWTCRRSGHSRSADIPAIVSPADLPAIVTPTEIPVMLILRKFRTCYDVSPADIPAIVAFLTRIQLRSLCAWSRVKIERFFDISK